MVLLNFLEDIEEPSPPTSARSSTFERSQKDPLCDDDVVFDFPDGLTLSCVDLYYDQYVILGISALFVANGSGVHLVRVNPPDNFRTRPEDDKERNKSSASDQTERSSSKSMHQVSQEHGLVLQRFSLDVDHHFGKGGLSLAIIGTDTGGFDSEKRRLEEMNDIELGDAEFLFSCKIAYDAVASLSRITAPIRGQKEKSQSDDGDNCPHTASNDSYLLGTAVTASALFLSDDFFPFTRLTLSSLAARSETIVSTNFDTPAVGNSPSRLNARSLCLLNLSYGESFF